jgi:hypothetical protein
LKKKSANSILLTISMTIIAWLILGGLLGVAGVLLSSFIPFFGLGIFLALLGALLHSALIFKHISPAWWKVGLALAVVLSAFSIVLGTLAGNRFPPIFMLFFVGYYFVFGSIIYVIINNGIIAIFRDD